MTLGELIEALGGKLAQGSLQSLCCRRELR
jgi:hypothetical protein